MADSPLQTQDPAQSMVATAAGGNPMIQEMLATMMQQGQKRQGYLEQQQQAYNADLEKYAGMVTQSQSPESQEAGMWGSMAEAASNVAPTWGNIGPMLGRVGGAYGKNQDMNQQLDIKNQADLTKTRQAEVRALELKDQNAAMLRALQPTRGTAGHEFRKNADGTTTAFSRATGSPVGTYGPQDIGKISQLTQVLAKAAFDKGEYKTLNEALDWAQDEAFKRVGQMEESKGNRTAPLVGDVGGVPTTPKAGAQVVEGGVPGPTGADFKIDVSGLDANDKEIVMRLIKRYQANPNEGTMNQTAKMINDLLAKGSIKQVELPKKDVQTAAEKTAYGTTIGKNMGDTSIDLQKTGAAAGDLIGNLNTLEALYKEHGENIPEGAGGDLVNTFKSGLATLGVNIKGQGAADVVKGIATKQALQSRTADGQNLLPGAMSNYEDRLLQSMSPGLLMTQEGRLLAIQVAKAQMQMRVDLAAKAREYIKTNKRLDEGWFDVAAEVAKKNPFLNEARIKSLEKYAASLSKGK